MKWFKHMTDANRDEKMQLLRTKFGLEGYGAYWTILEVLAEQIKDSDRDYCEYPIKFWQNFLGFSPKKLQNFLEILSEFEIFSIKFSGNLVTIQTPKIKTIRDEHTRRENKKLRSNSGVTPEQEEDKEEEEDKERITTTTPQPPKGQLLPQPIFENSHHQSQTEAGLTLVLKRKDGTRQTEVEWLMQNLIHHIRSGRNGKMQLHDGTLAGLVGVHPEAKKLLFEWKRQGDAERMASIALAANSATATNELRYALAAIKNKYDGYLNNLKTSTAAVAAGDMEIEL